MFKTIRPRFSWSVFRRHPQMKLVRYALAGTAVSVGYTVTVVLLVDGLRWMSPEFASAASFALWTPISYWIHRDFTFLFEVGGSQVTAIVKFIISFVFRLALAAYTVHLATTLFGSPYLVGVLANWIVLPLFSYLVLDLWVFRRARSEVAAQA
jgi:putative flippase GtrA